MENREQAEEILRLKLEIRKLSRQLNLSNDNMRKYRSVTSAKQNLSAVIAAEKSKQEKQLQVILDNSPNMVILLDGSFNFMLSTQSFLNFTGMPGFEFLHNKTFRQVFSVLAGSAWIDRMEDIFKKAIDTQQTQLLDGSFNTGTPEKLHIYSVSVVPFVYSGEKAEGILVNFNDITEHIEMENLIKESLDKATAASKAKGDFLANMSHEIRTPMNAIIGMTDIGKSASSAEQKNYSLLKISDASKHLLGIINDILDMSKIEAGKFGLCETVFVFGKMLERVANVVSYRAEEKNQKFEICVDSKIPKILIGDDQRLTQVITNLAGNAIKFTPKEGSIKLDANFLEEENDVCTLRITVTDTGIGISKEQQQKLFQSFQQAENHTSRKFGGTGLGLAISKSIVNMMDGDIWVQSEPGKGSVFGFTVKLKRGSEDELSRELRDTENGVEISGIFTGRQILLVEDMEINREILTTLLQPTNLAIDCAVNGAEAVEIFSKTPDKYELIFMDLQMPEMDGFEATRRIRAIEANNAASFFETKNVLEFAQQTPQLSERPKGVPIIAMTANVFKKDIEHCIKAGMDGHVGKPIDINEITGILQKFLLRRIIVKNGG
ncbi:MAG: ATP-binding protein [Treponema sp.]|nr:ATP-binding protein [Treponema sp.]